MREVEQEAAKEQADGVKPPKENSLGKTDAL